MYYYKDNMQDKINIAGVIEESIVDGPGIRFVIFTQGCPHNCKGCHNPQTHDFNLDKYEDIAELSLKIKANPLLRGITLSGGEPFMQAEKLVRLIDSINNKNLDIITYTGFTFEELLEKSNSSNYFKELLNRTDILIDGKFELDKKDENLVFKGSSNQRAIDVKQSLKLNKIIEHIFY